jgi:hypothetical protein
MPFESIFSTTELNATVTVEVKDPNGITPPSTIIQTDDSWMVEVTLELEGTALPYLGGQWLATVYEESIGPGDERKLGSETLPITGADEYVFTINVPSFVADPSPTGGLGPGTYRLVTVINYENFAVPLEMVAYQEGPVIQMYEHA